jgi:outer membrane protein assembly factor BamB
MQVSQRRLRAFIPFLFAFLFTGELLAVSSLELRPFRLRSLRLTPGVDASKPVGVSLRSGFSVQGDTLVGDWGDGWVGARSVNGNRFSWWFDAGSDVTSPIFNAGGFIVFSTRSGKVFKVDIASGKRAWEASLDAFSDRKPLVSGSTVIIQAASQVIYAIDYQTGKSLWLFDAGFPEGLTVGGGPAPVVWADALVVGLANGDVVGINLQSGKEVWRSTPPAGEARFRDVVGELFVRDGTLFVARYDGSVTALDIKDAKGEARTVWQEKFPAIAVVTHRNGKMFLGCVNGDVLALDELNQGRQLWRIANGGSVSTLTAAESRILSTTSDGRIFAMDMQTGELIWHDSVGYAVFAAPLFMDDGIYFITGLGNVYGYRLL